MNREQRRHPEQAAEEQAQESPSKRPEDGMAADERQPDDLSVRAKSSGHGKKTADKWNQ